MTRRSNAGLNRPSEQLIAEFTDIVGAKNVVRDPDEMVPYLHEWRDKYTGKAALILKPGSTADVSSILKLANKTNTAIVPQGGNTGLVGGQIPFESGNEIVVAMSRMNRILNRDPLGNTMTVEAGVILQHIQEAADEVDRLFPLSLSAEGSCQIGGCIATNAGGIAVLAYGNARSLVLGLESVLADGQVWNGLRALRKDNTGYDLKDLFIGSEGTLGIITAAVLKLFPKPAAKTTAFIGLESLEKVAEFFNGIHHLAGASLTAFELLPRIGLQFVLRHAASARDPLANPHNWYVLLEVSQAGNRDGTTERLEQGLSDALTKNIIADAAVATSLAQSKQFWHIRDVMSEMQKPEGGSIKHDVSVPVAKIPDFIKSADKLVERLIPGSRPVPFGHFGDGNIHYNVSQPVAMDRDDFLDQWDQLSSAVYELVVDLGGSISAEHGIGRMKRELLKKVKDPVEIDLMRRIKQTFDPNGILNPGKVI